MADIEQEKQQMMSNDLSPAAMEKARAPKKTWFFERMGDKKIFACEEREAWQIVYNRSNWRRRDFRMLGTSDGKTFKRIVDESMSRANVLRPQIEAKTTELEKYQLAEEKLIMNDVVDMEGDPADEFNEVNKQKVLRLRTIIDRIHGELDTLEDEFKKVVGDVIQTATDAEMKIAMGNQKALAEAGEELDWPKESAFGRNTPDASPQQRKKIMGIMSGRI